MADLRVGYYGDDVTGSVDVLLQFARHGADGRLFVGVPDAAALAAAAAECTVVGIAGIARSLPADELDAEVRPALEALREIDPDIVQYKACSTADSSPDIGSLGRVVEIGRDVFGDRTVPMLFAQPDFGRYTAFGHHFAAEDGVVHRLDRQPTMSSHPSTPMDESDLARHIARQTPLPIGALAFTAFSSPAAVASALRTSDRAAIVLDALDDTHLALVGAALSRLERPLFAIGSGGLSRALALAGSSDGHSRIPGRSSMTGPVLVVSGSRSPQTRRQADAAAAAGWLVRPIPFDGDTADVIDALREDRSVVLTSDDVVVDGDVLAEIARAAASVALEALRAGATTRLVVCGGDSSGRVVRRLGVRSLSIAANPEGNVVLLRAESDDPAVDGAELLLKGGQVGSDHLFVDLAHVST
ncbi:MAG: four-carbon acid sugar kinase family protein [Microbacterium sp.]